MAPPWLDFSDRQNRARFLTWRLYRASTALHQLLTGHRLRGDYTGQMTLFALLLSLILLLSLTLLGGGFEARVESRL
jgi:hypothetical protein